MSNLPSVVRGMSAFMQDHQVSFVNGLLVVFTVGGEQIFRFAAFRCPCQQPVAFAYGFSFMIGPALVLGMIVFTVGGEKIFHFASFKCPCQQPLASVYSSSFMIGPAVIMGVIGILVNNLTWRLCHGCMYRSPRSRHGVPETIRQCSSVFARSCVVPSAWLFVTLLDGNYYVCLVSTAPCETESEENRRLVATSQIISWIFLVTTVAIATLVMIFSRCMDHMTFVHSRYLSIYRDAERQQFEELMTKKAQQLAKLNAEVFLNESKLQKEDWDAISMAPSYKVAIAVDKEEEPLYTPLHKWAFRHQVPGK